MSCACVDPRRHRAFGTDAGEGHVLGAHAEGHGAEIGQAAVGEREPMAGDVDARAGRRRRQEIHSRRADEVADEGVLRPVEELRGAAGLDRAAARHHHHLLGEGERLDLVVGDVDQGELELLVDLLELPAQLPLEVRIDDRERLVEQHRRDVLAHQAAAERDLLLGVGGEARRRACSAGRSARASRRSGRRGGRCARAPRRGCAAERRGSRPPSSCRR